jgi:hypothetical protein
MVSSRFLAGKKRLGFSIAFVVLAYAAPGVVFGDIVDTYSTGFESSQGFTVGPMSDGTSTQGGWSGGAQSGFQNDNAGSEAITTAAANSGTQSWLLKNSYSSPGQGTPYTPNLSASLGDSGITDFTGSVSFMAAGIADGSSIAISTGTPDGTDRGDYIAYLVNETGGIHLYTYTYDVNNPDPNARFSAVDIATGLSALDWHQLSFDITKSGAIDILKISVDGGPSVTVNPDGLNAYRADPSNSFGYADSSRLKIYATGISAGPPSTPDPGAAGFYIDDVTYSVLDAATVPEASSLIVWSLFGMTIGGAGWWRRKRSA